MSSKKGSPENTNDPDEFLFEDGYPITQTSPFQNFIDYCKPSELNQKRKKFNKRPIYLKNTLFHPDHCKKIRKRELSDKLSAFDDFKRAGNKFYHTKDYEKALECYGYAYGLFKYLEFKIEDDLKLKTITDDALTYFFPKEANEIKLFKPSIVIILINLAAAMIPLKHFNEAIAAITEALEYDPDNASLYSKRSQIRYHNLASNEKELILALEDAKTYSQMSGIKWSLIGKLETKFNEYKSEELTLVKEITSSLARHGIGDSEELSNEVEFEQKVVNRMVEKYEEILRFYQEGNKYLQRARVRKEMGEVQPIFFKMKKILDLTVENETFKHELVESGFDPQDKKVICSVESIKKFKISMTFSGGKLNDQLLNWCIDKCSEEEKLKRSAEVDTKPKKRWSWKYLIIGAVVIAAVGWGIKKYFKL